MSVPSFADGIGGLSVRLRSGQLTSVGLVEECLRRVEAEPEINAVVEIDADAALRSAADCDHRLRLSHAVPEPLCGIPVTVKRTFQVRGFAHGAHDVAAGAPHGVAAERDALAVARLRAAGAVVLGRSNAPARAADIDTWHQEHGRTAHPLDPERSPGGSSGGSAAAVAAGHTVFDIGSDVAGSARIPAHVCGVFAFRPTVGTMPTLGHVPGPVTEWDTPDMLAVCPLTRSAADLSLVWKTLWGSHGSGVRAAGPSTIAAVLSDGSAPVSDEVTAGLRAAVERLRADGYRIDEVELPVGLAENWLLCQQLLYAEDDTEVPADAEPAPKVGTDPVSIAWWCAGMSHHDWRRLDRVRAEYRLRWQRFFSRYSALLLPVMGTTALPLRDSRVPLLADHTTVGDTEVPLFSLSIWCAMASVGGLPAVSMPVTPAGSGLPVGLQVVAGQGRDAELLALVERLASVISPNPTTKAHM
ncbi:amidase family protein [Streptomyces sp. NBC_00258]|uniref:amidase family protein n=1 Tax=Streptomyces sp. NBC_00258 TaxID=2903642 RepID=UPI002E292C3D|nr:amidase family protein [Streptomyces sp. NBC_00258]